jgi:hypothetical protein
VEECQAQMPERLLGTRFRVGASFGIELHSKRLKVLPKILQQCDKLDIGWRHCATRQARHEHDAVQGKFNNTL